MMAFDLNAVVTAKFREFLGGNGLERCKDKRKDQKDKSHSNDVHEKPVELDGLRDAIASARKTLKQALGDTNGR